ncbi:MAG: GGDEF domain-containing protein [Planctomycetes bacterium]|nr:GGDEF domain-containing protein [Planctomycetota bacterium]
MSERTGGQRWFYVGSRDAVRAALTAWRGTPPASEPIASAGSGEVVVVDARAAGADVAALPHGHAFAGVRALKLTPGLRVLVVVDGDDRVGAQLARFCLADGVLVWDGAAGRLDTAAASRSHAAAAGAPRRPAVEDLLRKVERGLHAGSPSALQRLLQFERDDRLLHRLQDPETGLFDGPYATLKLDEEWKRAMRFHQPLSLLLIDLGAGLERLPDADRRRLLAEAAGVFLNECRDIDVLARFAPSVFLLLLPGTGPDGAEVLARRTLQALADRLPGGSGLQPSAGLCTVPDSAIPDRRAFLAAAEACLQAAAAGGAGGLCTSWQ